ncbi:hypothetical protein ACWKSR_10495, partial [Campylobacter fetus subsp. venerealis]
DLISSDFNADVSTQIWEAFGRALGEFLFPYLIRLHSEGVVLGGKISLAEEQYLPTTRAYLETMGYPVPINISVLGERAALIGACLPFVKSDL